MLGEHSLLSRSFLCLILVIHAGCVLRVQATTQLDSSQTSSQAVSLMTVYQLALKRNAQLALAKATYKAAHTAIDQSRSQLLPQLSGSFQGGYYQDQYPKSVSTTMAVSQNGTAYSWGITLKQSLFDWEKWVQYKSSKIQDKMARLTLAISEQQLIYDVADQYFSVLKAQYAELLAVSYAEAIQSHVSNIEARYQLGSVPEVELLQAKADYTQAEASTLQSHHQVTIKLNHLSLLTQTPMDVLYGINPKIPMLLPTPNDLNGWIQQANHNNLKIKYSELALMLESTKMKASRLSFLPTVSAKINYLNYDSQRMMEMNQYGGQANHFSAVISVEVPIFTGGFASSAQRQQKFFTEASEANADYQKQMTQFAMRNIWSTLQTNQKSIHANLQNVRAAREALRVIKLSYDAGSKTWLELLKSQSALYDAKKQYWFTHYDMILNTLALKQISGSLCSEDLFALSQWMSPGLQELEEIKSSPISIKKNKNES